LKSLAVRHNAMMSPSDLYELFEQHPNQAFRLSMASGDQIIVDNPRRTLIVSLMLYVGISDDPDSPIAKNSKFVSIPNINIVEPIDRSRLRPRRRSR